MTDEELIDFLRTKQFLSLRNQRELQDAAATRLAALIEERDRLREALQPFAAVADEYHDSESDDFEVWQDVGPQRLIRASFKLSNYRAARAALQPKDADHD